jgi:hypothetical protein
MNDRQSRTAEEIARLKQLRIESGKSKKQFSEEYGINYMTFMTRNSAMFCSFLGSCKANGMNREEWFTDVPESIPKQNHCSCMRCSRIIVSRPPS